MESFSATALPAMAFWAVAITVSTGLLPWSSVDLNKVIKIACGEMGSGQGIMLKYLVNVPEIAVFSINIGIFRTKNIALLSPCAPAETAPFWPPKCHHRANFSLYFRIISMYIRNIAWPDPILHPISTPFCIHWNHGYGHGLNSQRKRLANRPLNHSLPQYVVFFLWHHKVVRLPFLPEFYNFSEASLELLKMDEPARKGILKPLLMSSSIHSMPAQGHTR